MQPDTSLLQISAEGQSESNIKQHQQADLGNALQRKLKKYLEVQQQKKQKQAASLDDIAIHPDALENMSMEQVIKIAEKASKNQKNSQIKPMDRVVMFLQQEQKLIQQQQEEKRNEAINEIVAEQKKKQPKSVNESTVESATSQKVSQQHTQLSDQTTLQTDENLVAQQISNRSDSQKIAFLNKQQPATQKHKQSFSQEDLDSVKANLQKKIQSSQKESSSKMSSPTTPKPSPNISGKESVNEEDNMSLSEIIAKKYKQQMHVRQLRSPEEAAQVLVKDTKSFNVNDEKYTQGTNQEQKAYQEELGNVETNLAASWSDLGQLKQALWQKLHKINEIKKEEKATNLAQIANIKESKEAKEQKIKDDYANRPLKDRLYDGANKIQVIGFNLYKYGNLDKSGIKLYEVDSTVIIILIVVVAILLCICFMCCCTCCVLGSAASQAKEKQQEAYKQLVEEQQKKKREQEEQKKNGQDKMEEPAMMEADMEQQTPAEGE